LNCFWTKSLGLYENYKYDYKFKASVGFCSVSNNNLDRIIAVDTTPEIILYMQNEIKRRDIKIFDNQFIQIFPTNNLINGGWFPGYRRLKKNSNHDNIFEFNEENRNCIPMARIAILIPYRNREENLNNFLIYMHYYLQKQQKAYKIFVIEQSDGTSLFNKGRLYNIGFRHIIENEKEWEFNCIFLHDIDLLPVNFDLDYSCSDMPKHLSINVTRLSDNSKSPHYRFLTGGVLALRPEHYIKTNGYSNEYWVIIKLISFYKIKV